ncbi:hypothetical protein [Massilia sp. Leaf139]|uniref:hypothetical protein n=1 Tax=Massilia sp. Leaf139 TaxID=1736272 RepID=UPI0006FAF1C1|nr:hypothetical protein [Massilia sp. Leaf139]KQQ87836.1 hypothetical protein ASF77_13955 [Massilia sp. Leaf139]
MTAFFVRTLAILALLCGAGSSWATPHVFLVQNSGWMEPFYSDPKSPFKPLVTELALAVARPGDALVLAAFNQSQPNAPSPRALLSATVGQGTRGDVTRVLAGLDTARKAGGALADTDLGEAVSAAMTQALGGRDGIVWLVTNNRNSPNNDQATAQRNREFYQLIHNGSKIRTALAFPLRMPVKGQHYTANGLMVYAFAIGESGARALDSLLASGAIKRIITEPPARLKPLDRNTVRLVPRKVENAPGVTFAMGANGVLRADVAPDATAPNAKIGWNLENTMYPYTIVSAALSARSTLGGEGRAVSLGSSRVATLAPGKPQPLDSTLQLPTAQLPGKWSMAALKAAGSAYVLPGTIELHLADQKLALSQGFRSRMTELFPGDPLPDIFTPPSQVQASTAVLPIEVRVHYGSGPLIAAGGALLALLAAGAAAAYGWMRPRRAVLTVEDEQRVMHARTGTVQPIYDKAGNEVARLKTTLFGHQLIDLREGAQVRLER